MPTFAGWINPLKCPDIDLILLPPDAPAIPSADRLLNYLCAPGSGEDPEAFVVRYKEIATTPDPLSIVPAEPTILDKLVWPLRHAKGSYALGNYLGCIALCGMVGEMVAMLLWDIAKVALQGKPMTEDHQRALFGSTFEKLGQMRRVEVMQALKLVDESGKAAFDSLREIRRRYLHLLSQTHEQVAHDARRAFSDALSLVAIVLGMTFQNGAVVLRPDLMAYLTEKGIVSEPPQ
jgi:hypothetical protein